jgi:hypothetical protein
MSLTEPLLVEEKGDICTEIHAFLSRTRFLRTTANRNKSADVVADGTSSRSEIATCRRGARKKEDFILRCVAMNTSRTPLDPPLSPPQGGSLSS